MPDDEYSSGREAQEAKQKRLLGEQLRKDFDAMLDYIWEANSETMSITDWRKMVNVWMQQNVRTMEQFLAILNYAKGHGIEHPSNSDTFKDAFAKHAAICIANTLHLTYRDVFTWLAFMSGGSRRERRRKHMSHMEEIGL